MTMKFDLSLFLPEHVDKLSGLFYRVGLWMSHVDDTDVEDTSELAEYAVLLKTIERVSNSAKMPSLIQDLALHCLKTKERYAEWGKMEYHLLEDVYEAIHLLRAKTDAHHFNGYRAALMLVANAVAKAYREEADQEGLGATLFERLAEKITNFFMSATDRAYYEELNISPAEDTALTDLRETLQKPAPKI
jgi:hypothetical protein